MPNVNPRLENVDATSISKNLILENNIPGFVAWKYTLRLDMCIVFTKLVGRL